jgi:hypothetical protein
MGFTVSPTTDDRGNYTGVEVHSTTARENFTDRQGMVVGNDRDYYEDAEGQFHHLFEETELKDESSPTEFDPTDYWGGVMETEPWITNAVALASTNPELMPEGFIDDWNNAIDNEDLNKFHEMKDFLSSWFNEQDFNPNDYESDGEPQNYHDEWFSELPQETVDENINYLMSLEFDSEDAEEFANYSNNYAQGSPEHAILTKFVDVAFGKNTMEDAMNEVASRHGMTTTFAAFTQLRHDFQF